MNTAIIRLALLLLLGICSGFYLEWHPKMSFLVLLPAAILFLVAYFRARKLLFPDHFFGSSVFLLFFTLGIFITSVHLPTHQPEHYVNKIPSEDTPILKLSIREALKPDLFNNKYIAEVKFVNSENAHGKLLLLSPKDSLKKPFLEGEEIIVSTTPAVIPSPLNPHQFDYEKFMASKGVLRQVNLQGKVFVELPTRNSALEVTASNLRKKITQALKKRGFKEDELAVIQALLLGQKQDISVETYNNFAAAGAIHILAVSGLHVGIILMLLHWLFKPLKRIKKGKILKTLCIILCLWGFAVLSGLSPSVVRAVTMFSFIAVGLEINRRTSTINSIFLSLLLLLLIKPQWIFQVGFQLSYLAVISIVLFQPLLSRLVYPSSKILKYLWDLLTVSIAAQIGVLPLSLFYFHQFPGLFFLTNLLILPFLGLILILGVVVMFLSVLDVLPTFLAKSYESIIKVLNLTVEWIAKKEQFLLKDIPFSTVEVFGWYLFFFLVFLLWKRPNYIRIVTVLFSITILQGIHLFQKADQEDKLLVFHKSRSSIVGLQKGEKLKLYNNLSIKADDLKIIENFSLGEGLASIEEEDLKNIYFQKGHFLILIDSSGILPATIPENPNLLLSGSPKVNLERIISTSPPNRIIADGSNFPFLVNRWRKTAHKHGVPFHYTGEDGAFVLK